MRQVEVLFGCIAPPAQGVLGAVVRGRDGDGGSPRKAVLGPRGVARQSVARAAAEPCVEQRGAQRRGVGAVAGGIQVAIPTRTACAQYEPSKKSAKHSGTTIDRKTIASHCNDVQSNVAEN